MSNELFFILGFILLSYFLDMFVKRIRRKLSGWNYIEQLYKTNSEPDEKSLYGIHAAFYHAQSKYPLADTFAKIKITSEGLYFKFQLFFEIPKVYKPVFIPWKNIRFEKTNKDDKLGFDKYHIYYQDKRIGMICLQPFVSENVLIEIEKLNINLNNYKN